MSWRCLVLYLHDYSTMECATEANVNRKYSSYLYDNYTAVSCERKIPYFA